jgi:RNA polymerase-binding transcription factor DksA
MADQKTTPLLTNILPMYKGIYPDETVEVVYNYLKNRIGTLQPIVEANGKKPLMTAEEKESFEPGGAEPEIALRVKNNESTENELNNCKAAWERLINGTAHLCTVCGGKIDKDRKQAKPAASKCRKCQEEIKLSKN